MPCRGACQIIEVLPEEVKRIVTTNDVGRPRRTPLHTQFVLFEFGGETLKAYRRRADVDLLPFSRLWRIGTDIVAGVMHLERHNMVHRDLKLDNVLVDEHGKCQLVDFGLAVRVDPVTRSIKFRTGQAPGGNIAHLAPEVLSLNSIVVRSSADETFDMPCVTSAPTHGRAPVTCVANAGRACRRRRCRYGKQSVFALGVLLSEVAIGEHPLPNYPGAARDAARPQSRAVSRSRWSRL